MIGNNTTKQCPWKACTKTYGQHTIEELNNHKSLSNTDPQTWFKWQRFATVASIFTSVLLTLYIILGVI